MPSTAVLLRVSPRSCAGGYSRLRSGCPPCGISCRLFLDLLSLLHPLLGLASVEMRRQTVCRELPSQARTVDRDTRTVIDERRTVDTSCVGAAQHGRDPFRFQQTAELLRGTGSTQHPHDGLPRTVERRTVPQCLPAAGVVPFECPVSYVASYTARLDRYTLWRGVVIERTVEDTGILVSVCRTPGTLRWRR